MISCRVYHCIVVAFLDFTNFLTITFDGLKICLNIAVGVDDLVPVEDGGPAAVESQGPEVIGSLVAEEGVAEHEPEHDPPLHRVEGQVLARHRVRVGGVQQLGRVGDQGQHLGGAPLVSGEITAGIHGGQRQQGVGQGPRVRDKLLRQLLERRIVVDNHLSQSRK